jgi:single-strand DNA-binding protein
MKMRNLRNSVQLIGNLGADPEVRTIANGRMLARIRVATTESYKNKEGERIKQTFWHNIVAWGSTADIMAKYLQKGSLVAVEGKLVHRSYESTQGETKYVTEVVANEVQMIGSKAKAKAA